MLRRCFRSSRCASRRAVAAWICAIRDVKRGRRQREHTHPKKKGKERGKRKERRKRKKKKPAKNTTRRRIGRVECGNRAVVEGVAGSPEWAVEHTMRNRGSKNRRYAELQYSTGGDELFSNPSKKIPLRRRQRWTARKAKEYEKEGSRGLDIMSETENARALAVEDGYTDRQATKYISFFFAVMKSRDGE